MSLGEILTIANLSEVGGGHNQKGINFQRIWAIVRMFELEGDDQDFLLLFEAIQDVAEFDSENQPTSVVVYQVKKKDGAHWKWNELTGFLELKSKKSAQQPPSDVKASALGKLYASVIAFKELKSTGAFVSNMGCELSLEAGGIAASTLGCDMSLLESKHLSRLSAGFETLHEPGDPAPDLARISVKKVPLHPDSPEKALVGTAHLFLKGRSPTHANQAETLVDTLLAKISPLGAKTDTCTSFDELRKQRGYSRTEFKKALAGLEQIPDIKSTVCAWIDSWPSDPQFDFVQRGRTKVEIGKIFQNRLAGHVDPTEAPLVSAIDTWRSQHPIGSDVAPHLHAARLALAPMFPDVRPERLCAHFLMRVAQLCAAPTSDS